MRWWRGGDERDLRDGDDGGDDAGGAGSRGDGLGEGDCRHRGCLACGRGGDGDDLGACGRGDGLGSGGGDKGDGAGDGGADGRVLWDECGADAREVGEGCLDFGLGLAPAVAAVYYRGCEAWEGAEAGCVAVGGAGCFGEPGVHAAGEERGSRGVGGWGLGGG